MLDLIVPGTEMWETLTEKEQKQILHRMKIRDCEDGLQNSIKKLNIYQNHLETFSTVDCGEFDIERDKIRDRLISKRNDAAYHVVMSQRMLQILIDEQIKMSKGIL